MPFITILFALDLIIIGFLGYVITGKEHLTALIPAVIGAILLAMGFLAFIPNLRKHVMHGAASVALLGIIGTFSGLTDLPKLLSGEISSLTKPAASISRIVTNILLIHFVIICIISFIEARIARKNAEK